VIRLGRKVADEPSAAGLRLSAYVAVLLRDSEEAYRRLLREYEADGTSRDLRAAALQLARRIAAYERLAIISAEELLTLSGPLSPNPGLTVLQLLSYALVALGQEDVDASVLLSDSELDERIEAAGARAWRDAALDALPDDWEAT
jgi:MoxR-like ATPase